MRALRTKIPLLNQPPYIVPNTHDGSAPIEKALSRVTVITMAIDYITELEGKLSAEAHFDCA